MDMVCHWVVCMLVTSTVICSCHLSMAIPPLLSFIWRLASKWWQRWYFFLFILFVSRFIQDVVERRKRVTAVEQPNHGSELQEWLKSQNRLDIDIKIYITEQKKTKNNNLNANRNTKQNKKKKYNNKNICAFYACDFCLNSFPLSLFFCFVSFIKAPMS